MSIESWEAEFYPVEASSSVSDVEALKQAILKWSGLRPENLEKHAVRLLDAYIINGDDEQDKFWVGGKTCSLCHKYKCWLGGSGDCAACPLKSCSVEYRELLFYGHPEIMIGLLERTLEKLNTTCLVQVGKGKGSYKTRYSFDNENRARMWYKCINIGNGYKKRLIINGKVVERVLS